MMQDKKGGYLDLLNGMAMSASLAVSLDCVSTERVKAGDATREELALLSSKLLLEACLGGKEGLDDGSKAIGMLLRAVCLFADCVPQDPQALGSLGVIVSTMGSLLCTTKPPPEAPLDMLGIQDAYLAVAERLAREVVGHA